MKRASFLACTLVILTTPAFSMDMPSAGDNPVQTKGQGEILVGSSPAYNAPATIDVNHKNCRLRPNCVNAFVDASFTYWYAGEEGLSVASLGTLNTDTGILYFSPNTATLFQSSGYKPGFKVGLGIVGDQEWVLHAEYTWFRGSTTMHSGAGLSSTGPTAGTATSAAGNAVWGVNDWFLQGSTYGQALSGPQISATWQLGMDLADLTFGRPFYQGRWITISPFGGMRAAWIRQSMVVKLTEAAGIVPTSLPSQPIESRNHSTSWAIGPRFGLEGDCLLPMGFRFEGDIAASLLYTRYNVYHSEDIASTAFNPGPYTAAFKNYNALRPMLEMGLGVSWGKYLYNKDLHIDFSADYDFMIFWSQNMMRKLLDDTLTGTSPASSELYFHGLTLTGRFDF